MTWRRATAAFCALALVELGALGVIYWRYQDEILDVDGLTSALVARTLFEGHGYRTPVLSLFETNIYFREGRLADGPPWPNANRFPLPVLTRQVYFAAFGVNTFTGYYLDSLLFHFLATCALWWLARWVTRDALAASFGAFLFIAHPHVITTAIRGTNYSLETFLYLCLGAVLVHALRLERPSQGWMVAVGAVVGLGFLNRYSSGAFWMLAVLACLGGVRGAPVYATLRAAGCVIFGTALVIAPFLVWSWKTFGRPIYSNQVGLQLIHLTALARGMNPWWQLEYAVDPRSLLGIVLGDPWGLTLKMVRFLADLAIRLPTLHGQPWLWVFIGLGLSGAHGDGAQRGRALTLLMRLTAVIAGLQLVLLPPLGGGINYFWYLFVVPYLVAGVGLARGTRAIVALGKADDRAQAMSLVAHAAWTCLGVLGAWISVALWTVRREMPLNHVLAVGGACAAVAAGLVAAAWVSRRAKAKGLFQATAVAWILPVPLLYLALGSHFVGEWSRGRTLNYDWKTEWNAEWLRRVVDRAPPGILLALSPWKVAWITGRAVLPLPDDPSEVEAMIEKYKLPIAGVLLEPVTWAFVRDSSAPPSFMAYQAVLERVATLPGFKLAASDAAVSLRTFGVRDSRGGESDAPEPQARVVLHPLYRADCAASWFQVGADGFPGVVLVQGKQEEITAWFFGSRVRHHEVVEFGSKRVVVVDHELSFYLRAPETYELAIELDGARGGAASMALTLNANRLRLGEVGRSLGSFNIGDRPSEFRLRLEREWLAPGTNRIGIRLEPRLWHHVHSSDLYRGPIKRIELRRVRS